MENIVLTVHLLLALSLILSVLLQRSEGGGLGIGGGGGAGSSRPPTSPVAKLTWILAIGFLCTSLALTWIAASNSSGRSVIDGVTLEQDDSGDALLPPALGDNLLPPSPTDAPTPPPAAE